MRIFTEAQGMKVKAVVYRLGYDFDAMSRNQMFSEIAFQFIRKHIDEQEFSNMLNKINILNSGRLKR